MKKSLRYLLVVLSLVLFLGSFCTGCETKKEPRVILYDGPATIVDATQDDLAAVSESDRDITLKHCVDTQIRVNGQECYVYDTNVNLSRSWSSNYLPALSRTPVAYFDFQVEAQIEITVPQQSLEEVTISPLSYGIEPVIDKENHTISFAITIPDTYTIMFNGSPERAIHIFANPIEENAPDPDDDNVIYYGPGEYTVGTINVSSGQTLYIAGGAVVHGRIQAEGAENVTIAGRGIIDGSLMPGWRGKAPFVAIEVNACKNVNISGILALNPNCWVCQGYETEGLTIDGLKIISCRPNGDGITLQSCRNVVVKNCFVRSWDDSLVVKNYYRSSENIRFENIQLWTDFAQSMEIGYETNKGKIEDASITNIIFDDICVLHNFHKPVISVHNGDDALISDVTFRNITVEDAQMGEGDGTELPYLIDLNIGYSSNWSSTEERGRIDNITIENVNVLSGKFCVSRINGYDPAHMVSNVTISGLTILGTQVTDAESGRFEITPETTFNISISK